MTRTALILAGSLAAAGAGLSLPAAASDAHVDLRIVLGTPHLVAYPYVVCPPRVVYPPHVVYHPHYRWHRHPHHHPHHYHPHRGKQDHGWGRREHGQDWGRQTYFVRLPAGRWHRD